MLKAHPAVNNAAVLLHKGAEGELSLAAYVEADPGHRGEIVREERAASRLEDGSRSGRTAGKALTRNASCLSGTR